MVDYFFVRCLNAVNSADYLRKDCIYSTKTNLYDPDLEHIELEEIPDLLWLKERFKKVRVPDISGLYQGILHP